MTSIENSGELACQVEVLTREEELAVACFYRYAEQEDLIAKSPATHDWGIRGRMGLTPRRCC